MTKHKIWKKFIKLTALAALFVAATSSIASCGSKKMVDYAHNGSVKLSLDYKGRDFFEDGIGQVTVNTYIDGDTTHFKNVNGDTTRTLKARYYGIDTPESTGGIQPYGKQASNFTKEKLSNAMENGTIVVSSPFSTSEDGGKGVYGQPKTDSTGERFLSLVWINETVKDAPVESLVLLNLWIVQEGLSWAKNTTEVPGYADTFSDAQIQAEKFKLKLWSNEPDPLFNYGSYESVSLLDVKHETELYLKDPTYVNKYSGANVRFTGVVSGYSNHNLYVQEYYPVDEDDPSKGGEWAGINIFTGMSALTTDYTKIGTYLQVVGVASNSETFGFQIAGTEGKWPASLQGGEDDCQILLTAEENVGIHALHTFEYTKDELNSNLENEVYENLFCRTKITEELVVEDAYVNDAGDEVTLYFEGCDFNAYIPFTYHGNPDDAGDVWMTADRFIGKTFSVSGVFGYHQTKSGNIKYQLIICGDSDLVCLTPTEGTVIAEPYTVSEAYDNASSAIPLVNYYVSGKVKEASVANGKPSFTLVEGDKEVEVVNAYVPDSVYDAGEDAINEFNAKIIPGSTLIMRGVPKVEGSKVIYEDTTVLSVYLHGQTKADPLTTQEAIDIAKELDADTYTSTLYYVTGKVTEIVSPYDADSKRMTFKIINDGVEFVITDSRMGRGDDDVVIDYNNVVVDAEVIVVARLHHTEDGVYTTYRNGCQVVSLI